MSFLFCLPFANRASVSGDLYIDFDRNHLIFPVACLVWQVTALFIIFLSKHAYASHIISCISFMYCIMLLVHFPWLIVVPLLVLLSWVEPGDEFVNEEPVEYAYEDQAFDNSENLAGKMTTPRNHFYLCFASCSFYCHGALPTTCYIMPPIFAMSASNHPFLANRCLAKLPLLLRPSYSVASCRWSWSWFHVGTWIFWNITISLI